MRSLNSAEKGECHSGRSLNSGGKRGCRIKRPLNCFMIFSQKRRRELSAECPGLHNTHISVLLGAEWAELSASHKALFVEQAQELKEHHRLKHPNYRYAPRSKVSRARARRRGGTTSSSRYVSAVQQPHRKRRASGCDVQSVDMLMAAKVAYFWHRDLGQGGSVERVLPEAVLEEVSRLQCLGPF
ncbi:transcription factor Sox-17-alpha-like [Babylonia areolata]|uniref:transcription factor Sox-17-alpha-like n=1 Tax=Babylonia areolata TaxID=304850 RepID=UPI003FCF0A65